MYHVATGGVKLQVPQPYSAEARILLSQTWAMPESADDLEDAWDDLDSDPGANRRSIMTAVVFFLLLSPLLIMGLSFVFGL